MALASRNDSPTGNELGHNSTSGLDTESERADIDKDDITQRLVTREDTTLDGSTVGNSLIGVDTLRGFLTEVLLQELLNSGDTSRTTNKDDLCRMVT